MNALEATRSPVPFTNVSTQDYKKAILFNPLFHLGVQGTATIAFGATVLTGLYSIPTIVFAKCLGIASLAILAQAYRFRKELLFRITLLFKMVKHIQSPIEYPWFNKIEGHNITLGALPLKNFKTIEQVKPKVVISLVEDFEQEAKGLCFDPYTEEDYKANGIRFIQLPAVDFEAVSLETIKKAIFYLADDIRKTDHIYIHCKGGVGRSATIVICYLIKKSPFLETLETKEETIQAAIDKATACRKAINLNSKQLEAIGKYYDFCEEVQSRSSARPANCPQS